MGASLVRAVVLMGAGSNDSFTGAVHQMLILQFIIAKLQF